MVYIPHIRMVVRGEFIGTPEEWSYSLKFRKVNPSNPDTETGDFQKAGVEAAIAAFHGASRFHDRVRVTGWRLYDILPTGLTDGNPRVEEYAAGTGPTGTGGNRTPLQVSLCMTHVAANRGAARFGRAFLPGPNLVLQPDMRITDVAALAFATDYVTYVKAISNAIDIPGSLVSVPMVNTSNVGAGREQEIDHISCGRVPDTIRRRRRQLLEEPAVSGHIDW